MDYVRSQYCQAATDVPPDSSALQNKVCQALTYLFTALYATEWQSFFDDLLALAGLSTGGPPVQATAVIFYLKTLSSIHDDIADVLAAREDAEQSRNTTLKDLIRSRDIQKLTSSWRNILVQFKGQDVKVLEQCLTVIGRWAGWNDLTLIVDNEVLALFFEFVSSGLSSEDSAAISLRDVALNTIMDILSKKMPGENKLDLIEVLKINDVVSQLTASRPLEELRHKSDYDTDLAEQVAKLVNQTVCDIVIILDDDRSGSTIAQRAHFQLKSFLPFLLRYFSDEYDEVSSSVIQGLTDVLAFIRKKRQSTGEYASMLPQILQAVVAKMKYDDTSTWADDDAQTDEAEFQDLRKRLGILQQQIASIDQALVVDTVSDLAVANFRDFQEKSGQVKWRDLELALHEMYALGQYASKSSALYSKGKPVSPAAERLIAMIQILAEIDITACSHPAIHLQYLELCVRYSTFFEANPAAIPRTLDNFVKLLHHEHIKVRYRSWYLFLRFVKPLRLQVGSMAETVLRAIGDLLPIKAELAEQADDDDGSMSSDDNERPQDPKFSNQLYLYEAAGNVSSSPTVSADSQVLFVRSITEPMLVDLQTSMNTALEYNEEAVRQVHHVIMALGAFAQGFSEWAPNKVSSSVGAPASKVSAEFSKCSEAILVALKTLNSPLEVRVAARSAFSRLFGVVGSRILPELPRWIEGLLPEDQRKEDISTFLRLLEQLVYGFKGEIHSILNTLLSPLLQKVFAALAEPTTGTDDELQLADIKSNYISFLFVILNNEVDGVLVSAENQATFETIITSLQHFSRDVSDLPSARMAFTVMARMVAVWGGPDLPATSPGVAPAEPQPRLPGFDRYAIDRFSPLVWAVASDPKCNPRDAQARQALSEGATLVKTVYLKTGEQYLNYLQATEFPRLGLNDAVRQAYLEAVVTFDLKKFRSYFQVGDTSSM